MVQLIVGDFLHEYVALVVQTDADILAKVLDIACTHRVCALTHIFCWRYGQCVARAICHPICQEDFKHSDLHNDHIHTELPD